MTNKHYSFVLSDITFAYFFFYSSNLFQIRNDYPSFAGRNCVRRITHASTNKEDKLRNAQSRRCNRYRSGRTAESPLDMRKLSPGTRARDREISFSLSATLYSPFLSLFHLSFFISPSSFSFSLSVPFFFFARPLTLATNHSIGHPISMLDTRIVHLFPCRFIRDQKTSKNL